MVIGTIQSASGKGKANGMQASDSAPRSSE
jgi:hypothetical protein